MLNMRVTLFVALFALPVITLSQPPSPTPAVSSQEQKNHSTDTKGNATTKERGTEKNPFIVKSLETEKSPETAEQERREQYEKSANERGLVVWTIVLAGATITLALVAAGQLGMFWRQLRFMRIAIEDGTKMANAAIDSNKLDREVFIADQRPWVSVELTEKNGPLEREESNLHTSFKYRLKNTGKTPAVGTSVSVTMIPFNVDSWIGDPMKGGTFVKGTSADEELQKWCGGMVRDLDDGRKVPAFGNWGRLIFPGEASEGAHHSHVPIAGFIERDAKTQGKGVVIFVLVCVTYKTVFDESVHQTGRVYAMTMRKPNVPADSTNIDLAALPIGVDQLTLGLFPASAGFAN